MAEQDKRILKTKRRLRTALIELLEEAPYEHLSVTDLCRKSGVSRITFYVHYGDKNEMVSEWFDEMFERASAIFSQLEAENNPEGGAVESCLNLLDGIFIMQEEYGDFIQSLLMEKNPYLAFAYYWYVLRQAEVCSRPFIQEIATLYPLAMTTNMICSGVWGFVRTGFQGHYPVESVKAQAKELLFHLLQSDILSDPGVAAKSLKE